MKFPAIPLLLAALSLLLLAAAEKPDRTWTVHGKSLRGTYRRCDGVTVWIRDAKAKQEVAMELASLSDADKAAVKALQSDFAWKLPLVQWPETVSVPDSRLDFKARRVSKDGLHTFRTRSFEYQCDVPLGPAVVGLFGRTFEATRELFDRLPWEVRPSPPHGPLYKARLFSRRSDFAKIVGMADQGNTIVAGYYLHSDGVIYVPLESILDGRHGNNGTLRHELAHQMMHDMLLLMPWWLAEGTAEYVQHLPWDGRAAYNCAAIRSRETLERLAKGGVFQQQAFEEMLTDVLPVSREARAGELYASVHGVVLEGLRKIQKERADWFAGKKAEGPAARNGPDLNPAPPPAPPAAPGDDPVVRMHKYHAAKLLVYYLQHLEGDGSGAKMLQLMWHLRQWADELNTERARFAKEEEQFLARAKAYAERAVEFGTMDADYRADLSNWRIAFKGLPSDPPKPVPPEDALLKLVPEPPAYAAFTPLRLQARWMEIKNKTIGPTPQQYYREIVEAFKSRRVTLPVN